MSGIRSGNRYEMRNLDETQPPNNSEKICGYRRDVVLKVGLAAVVLVALVVVVVVVAVLLSNSLGGEKRAPGLIYEPHIDPAIFYNASGLTSETREVISQLKDLFKKYDIHNDDHGQHLIECGPNKPADYENRLFCIFHTTWLLGECTEGLNFGYGKGKPCVFLLFNKFKNWVPEPFDNLDDIPSSMPFDLRAHIADETYSNPNGLMPKMLWVSCEGKNPVDKEHLGSILYSPYRGFPIQYFPYVDDPYYVAPMVAVQLDILKESTLVHIECKIWDNNVHRHHQDGQGTVTIEMLRY